MLSSRMVYSGNLIAYPKRLGPEGVQISERISEMQNGFNEALCSF